MAMDRGFATLWIVASHNSDVVTEDVPTKSREDRSTHKYCFHGKTCVFPDSDAFCHSPLAYERARTSLQGPQHFSLDCAVYFHVVGAPSVNFNNSNT